MRKKRLLQHLIDYVNCNFTSPHTKCFGTLAEWLRRGPAKAVGYACVSSNLTGVALVFEKFSENFQKIKIRKITKSGNVVDT